MVVTCHLVLGYWIGTQSDLKDKTSPKELQDHPPWNVVGDYPLIWSVLRLRQSLRGRQLVWIFLVLQSISGKMHVQCGGLFEHLLAAHRHHRVLCVEHSL